ncbi:peroxisomal Pex24-like protein [Metarhizium guizhouense ARSEF 977]|uniref:Peroxisomal Pex24-like protein n=1 Tax=Metarhizium guizhouense (strain ARSEF 977) TaxID=1276136 RepID=A0A0B4I4S9_METGA|nr:peroxisomal Pex24-like protein [Metarhizium guizhouense ARSEF 977]
MDDFTTEIIASAEGATGTKDSLQPSQRQDDKYQPQQEGQKKGWGGLTALRDRTSIQDRLVDRLLQQVMPIDGSVQDNNEAVPNPFERPNFNLTIMSNNFRRFNSRIGVVFRFQEKVEALLSWQTTSHTVSYLAILTFVCLDPYLLAALPIAFLVFGILVPGFVARHPAPPKGTLSSEQSIGYSPAGPPLAPAATPKPAKELSMDFVRNARDLQNQMGDFSNGYDKVVELLVPIANFSNEALSSTVFLFAFVGGIAMMLAAHMLPWRLIFLVAAWTPVVLCHPAVTRLLHQARQNQGKAQETLARTWLDGWIADDVILDSAPETREVEIFELQRKSAAGEWEPWVFSPNPYDPLSQARITGDRPKGTRFFEDVMPPSAWEWSEKKWALDLWSREWVEERIITGVEVETEGERWVYDIWSEKGDRTGVIDTPEPVQSKDMAMRQTSWEEGEDAIERRGDWRRRRWVRLVKRKATPES